MSVQEYYYLAESFQAESLPCATATPEMSELPNCRYVDCSKEHLAGTLAQAMTDEVCFRLESFMISLGAECADWVSSFENLIQQAGLIHNKKKA